MRPDFAVDDSGDVAGVDAVFSSNGTVGRAVLGVAANVADVLFSEDGKPIAHTLCGGQFATRLGAKPGFFVVLQRAVALAAVEAAAIALGDAFLVLGAGHTRVSAVAVTAAH